MKQQSLEVVVWWGDTILDHFHYDGDPRLLPELAVVVGPARQVELHSERRIDQDYTRTFTLSAFAHAFFVASSMLTPPKEMFAGDGLYRHASPLISVRLQPAKPKDAPKGRRDVGAFAGPAGLIGAKDRPRTKPGPMKNADPRNTGLLSVLRDMGGSTSAVMSGGTGAGLNSALSGLRGESGLAEVGGLGGMATRGTGSGGGGESIGIGGLKLGGGGIYGDRNGTGVELKGRRRALALPPKKFDLIGGLDKKDIQRVLQRARPRIKFCYEKELQADPNLSGKISTRFTIAPDGGVAAANILETTMSSEKVERCVVNVLRSLVFPRPKGGGIVVVMYPFIFEST